MPTPMDYSLFVRDQLADCDVTFLNAPSHRGEEDWRNVATREALQYSNSEYIWFTEQDFNVTDDKFWSDVEQHLSAKKAVIGVMQGQRLHPCCMFVRREVLEQTRRDFGIVPNVSDHFSMITSDLESMGTEFTLLDKNTYYHMNGLSHNMYLVSAGLTVGYKPEEFKTYLQKCLSSGVKLHPIFENMIRNYCNNTQ